MLFRGIKYKKLDVKTVTLIVFLCLVAILIIINFHHIRHLNLPRLIHYIKRYGKYAAICFLIIFSLKPLLLFLPSSMISIAAGTIFGPIIGFLLNLIGFYLSGTLAFFLSRFLGKDFVEKILGAKAVKINSNLEKSGFKIIFFIRFTPIIPFDPISYACGLSEIKYRDFIAASLLGVIPETLCYAFMGRNIFHPLSYRFLIPCGLVILAMGITTYYYKKSK